LWFDANANVCTYASFSSMSTPAPGR
jgi:hypothetical protein